MPVQVVVVGAGVAGLHAARLLHADGADLLLLEARERLGGRVLTTSAGGVEGAGDDGFDLGPSWIWPASQPAIRELVGELELPVFAQADDGDVVFERMSRETPRRYSTEPREAQTQRLRGGSAALVRSLAAPLPADRVRLETRVVRIEALSGWTRLHLARSGGAEEVVEARQVILAVPPRLLQATVAFDPPLPESTTATWRSTPTWMAPHAKLVAVYGSPFWRDAGLSGTAQSLVGPMLEIHDATSYGGRAALLGFLGVGPLERARTSQASLVRACLDQLARLFGPAAANPLATIYKDWALDPLTATADDLTSSGHPAPTESWIDGGWAERIMMAASETSPREAGYLAGAVEAGRLAAHAVRERLATAGRVRRGFQEGGHFSTRAATRS